MRKEPIHYCGIEIDEHVINRIKQIMETRWERYFENIHNIDDLCGKHGVEISQENIVLGEDWFISYSIEEYNIGILEWGALEDSKNKMAQTMEMFSVIKNILLLNKKKNIHALMRRDTSYQFYVRFLEKGYFKGEKFPVDEDYTFYDINFEITDKFVKKYKKKT